MPRSVLITTATLVVLAGLGGFWLGQRQLTVDSTEIINAVAARHVARHGGDVSACIGLPGQAAHVLHVRCDGLRYGVTRWGRVHLLEDGI